VKEVVIVHSLSAGVVSYLAHVRVVGYRNIESKAKESPHKEKSEEIGA